MKLSDLGERKILEDIVYPYLNSKFKNEDAAILRINADKYLIINIDTFVASTDAPETMNWYSIGWKTVTMCNSDIIAKGAEPLWFLDSIVVPEKTEAKLLHELVQGMHDACNFYKCKLVGGDIGGGYELVLSGISVGITDKPIRRVGGKPGDSVWITHAFGYTGVALHFLLRNGDPISDIDIALNKFYRPKLPPKYAVAISRVASASMDSSDGLAVTLNDLATTNSIKIEINNLPIPPIVSEYAKKNNLDPYDLIFFGGEEFEIIFLSNFGDEKIYKIFSSLGLDLPIKIGYASEGSGVVFNGSVVPRYGWEHFKSENNSH